jgi:hypothetical protein
MASANTRTGKAFIKIDGVLFETMNGATLTNPMGVERDAVVGTDVFGYSEKAVVPTITGKFAHGAGISLTDLASIVDSTITFECDSGPVFVLRNAWYANGMTLTGGSAELDVTFQGKKCEEQTL